jgi:predicted site-specific integrase-resolvase
MIERLTLKEAGELLNISPDALRMRIRRGTMNGEKDEEGKWYVWIDTAELEAERKAERSPNGESDDDMEALRRQVAVLQARLELIGDERDFLRKQVQALTIAQTKAIEGEKEPRRRRWRWPWER